MFSAERQKLINVLLLAPSECTIPLIVTSSGDRPSPARCPGPHGANGRTWSSSATHALRLRGYRSVEDGPYGEGQQNRQLGDVTEGIEVEDGLLDGGLTVDGDHRASQEDWANFVYCPL